MELKNFCAVLALIFFICTPKVEAKLVTDKLPLLTYAETSISVYDVPGGTKKGTISIGNSLVLVKVIRPDGWAYGSYKVANKKKRPYGWFNMNELQDYADFENYIDQSQNDVDAYRTRSSNKIVGKVSSNEDVIVVAKRGARIKIIFKADGNYYRMGWVDNYNLKKESTNYNLDTSNVSTDNNNSENEENIEPENSSNDTENIDDDVVFDDDVIIDDIDENFN